MAQEIYELNRGLDKIRIEIEKLQKTAILPIMIGVAGGSGSGKTTKVAKQIQNIFPKSKILSMDDYFRGREFMELAGSDNFDDPKMTDIELLVEHIKLLKRGLVILKPIYSFKLAERTSYEKFEPAEIIILEGLFALHDSITKELNIKVFVDISVHGSFLRRILRDLGDEGRTGQTENDIFNQYVNSVYPMYKLHIEPTKAEADLIIVNQYSPEIEAEKCESREVQIKAILEESLPRQKLEELGFCKIGIVSQEDIYYVSPFWKDNFTELMRIRLENGKCFLAYKGPLGGTFLRIKPKIEFETDLSLKNALEKLGYKKVLTLRKEREIWLGEGIELVVDNIKRHGIFIELRTPSPDGEKKLLDCLQKIGIDEKSVTKKSYLELFFT